MSGNVAQEYIRILITQIEAENAKSTPDVKKIEILQFHLKQILNMVGDFKNES